MGNRRRCGLVVGDFASAARLDLEGAEERKPRQAGVAIEQLTRGRVGGRRIVDARRRAWDGTCRASLRAASRELMCGSVALTRYVLYSRKQALEG